MGVFGVRVRLTGLGVFDGQEAQQHLSIFVDNSSIAGCQTWGSDHRLRIARFSEVVAGVKRVSLRVIGDLERRGEASMWRFWNQSGYWVEWKLPVAACLHEHVKNLERSGDRRREVLALCTADGRLVDTVECVATQGWRVEIWCWRAGCNSAYHGLVADPRLEGRVKICYLDGFLSHITGTVSDWDLTDERTNDVQPYTADASDEDEPRLEHLVFHEELEDPCVICLCSEAIFALNCCGRLLFCGTCMGDWLDRPEQHEQVGRRCPLCRQTAHSIR